MSIVTLTFVVVFRSAKAFLIKLDNSKAGSDLRTTWYRYWLRIFSRTQDVEGIRLTSEGRFASSRS